MATCSHLNLSRESPGEVRGKPLGISPGQFRENPRILPGNSREDSRGILRDIPGKIPGEFSGTSPGTSRHCSWKWPPPALHVRISLGVSARPQSPESPNYVLSRSWAHARWSRTKSALGTSRWGHSLEPVPGISWGAEKIPGTPRLRGRPALPQHLLFLFFVVFLYVSLRITLSLSKQRAT